MGPNMFRPRIHAPMFSKLRAAKSSSGPVEPPSWPNMRLKVLVANAHSCNPRPPTPMGFSRLCAAPAPKPSIEIVNALTQSLQRPVHHPQYLLEQSSGRWPVVFAHRHEHVADAVHGTDESDSTLPQTLGSGVRHAEVLAEQLRE